MPPPFHHAAGGDDTYDKEAACGILELVSLDSSPFSGVIKKRYTDFLVNEILPSGEVVHLTSLVLDKKKQLATKSEQADATDPTKDGTDTKAEPAVANETAVKDGSAVESESAEGRNEIIQPDPISQMTQDMSTPAGEAEGTTHASTSANDTKEQPEEPSVGKATQNDSVPISGPGVTVPTSMAVNGHSEKPDDSSVSKSADNADVPISEAGGQLVAPLSMDDTNEQAEDVSLNQSTEDGGVPIHGAKDKDHALSSRDHSLEKPEKTTTGLSTEEKDDASRQAEGMAHPSSSTNGKPVGHGMKREVASSTPSQDLLNKFCSQVVALPGNEDSDMATAKPKPPPKHGEVPEVNLERRKTHIHLVDGEWKEFTEEEEVALKADQEREVAQRKADGRDRLVFAPGTVYSKSEASKPGANGISAWQNFAGNEPNPQSDIAHEDRATLAAYFQPDVVDETFSLFGRIQRSPGKPAKFYGRVTSGKIERNHRKQVHEDLRRIFNSKLESVTDNDGHIIIMAAPKQPTFPGREASTNVGRNSNFRKPARAGPTWAERGGDYLHFTLHKENKDTMESISWLIKQLKSRPRDFHFAGTKDRRGVTVQRVCVYRIFVDKLMSVGRTLRGATIGDFQYRPDKLELGDLRGNEFTITMRDCHFESSSNDTVDAVNIERAKEVVSQSVKGLVERGFINYYGLQRFGTFTISTDEVGIAILKGDYHRAVSAILSFKPGCLEIDLHSKVHTGGISQDDGARAQGINIFLQTGDARRALELIPRRFSAEASIITHLGRKGREQDFLGALQKITRNARLMYVHAYQSLVWNHAASKRWSLYGDRVMQGDLVIVEKSQPAEAESSEVDTEGDVVVHAADGDRAIDADDKFTRARTISEEEAESGTYTIYDVVLPTPGWDVVYPTNDLGMFYENFMGSARGGGLDPHDMRRSWKDASLSGSYRKLLARPGSDISFEVKTYFDEDEQFVETDLEKYYKLHPKKPQWTAQRRTDRDRQPNRPQRSPRNPGPGIGFSSQDIRVIDGELPAQPAEAWHKFEQASAEDSSSNGKHTEGPALESEADDNIHQELTKTETSNSTSDHKVRDSNNGDTTMTDSDVSKPSLDVPVPSIARSTISLSTDASAEGGVNIVGHPRAPADAVADNTTNDHDEMDLGPSVPKEKIAVIIKMQLGSSTYATMALRELMKNGAKMWTPDFGGGR